MVEDVAEHSLLNLTRLELENESGLDDAVDGAQHLARAAASGEPPWTSVSMSVRGRPDQVDALRLTTPLSAVYVAALKDRMVGVVHWDTPTGTTLEGLSVVGREITIPGPLLDPHHVADK